MEQKKPTILVTGAAGFLGSAFARLAISKGANIVILDALTYAGYLGNIEEILKPASSTNEPWAEFVEGNICDYSLVDSLFQKYKFDAVINFAAETHVDNSITGPEIFVKTNVLGTCTLLEASRKYWAGMSADDRSKFRFVHVSTDEVFGQLGPSGKFTETTPYAPNSPYSASKAGSDLLVRAWYHTYSLPTITTNCSNNYGPRQFPEKLIPLMIVNALAGKELPVYGKGDNIRDWIHVEDHASGVWLAFQNGQIGETYCFGGNAERTNLNVVETICRNLDLLKPRADGKSYCEQIQFVEDRLGHDFRYAIDDSKAQKQLGFTRSFSKFEDGLKDTVKWYLANTNWLQGLQNQRAGK